MPMTEQRLNGIGKQALALVIGIFGGIVAWQVGLPLPWMLGPMIAVTIAAMAHAPVMAPIRLRPAVMPVIGVMLGSAVSADLLGMLGAWVTTLLLLPVFLACAAAWSYLIYRRIGGYDKTTAYFAAMPGGLNDILFIAAEVGGDERRIALAHAARILIVISFVALFFGLVLGVRSSGANAAWTGLGSLALTDYAVLGLCAVLGTWVGRIARLPAAPIFGPMVLSGIAHVAGWVTLPPPTLFVIAGQIVIGTIVGTRFAGATVTEVRRDLLLALPASGGMLIVATGFAEVIAQTSGIPLSQAFLAYSPGGLTEMSLLSLALDQDVAYVSVFHVIRITVVIGTAPLVYRLLRR